MKTDAQKKSNIPLTSSNQGSSQALKFSVNQINRLPHHLVDNYGRVMNYLRLAVTDKCNLRCNYCLPPQYGLFIPNDELMTWEEMHRISRLFIQLGVKKLRITGGEPFIRKGLVDFLAGLRNYSPDLEICITTNGVLVGDYLHELKNIGVNRLNFSLDTIDERTFKLITTKNYLKKILENIEKAYITGFNLKINMVVLKNLNDNEISNFVNTTRDKTLTVRFIEPMPFDTFGGVNLTMISEQEILAQLRSKFSIEPVFTGLQSVEELYQVPGYKGKIGIINGYSRSFCQWCSRLRISCRGEMRTCLYGKPAVNLRNMMRSNSSEKLMRQQIIHHIGQRKKNGFEAEAEVNKDKFESMSLIGG
jgi:cyclic pyranopterin phosphate synthase